MHSEKKRLTRSSSDKVVAGVLGGIAEHYNIDALWLRIGMAAAVLFSSGLFILAYFVTALIMPKLKKQ